MTKASPEKDRIRLDRFMETLHNICDGYELENPRWDEITLLTIYYEGLLSLRHLIEDPEEKAVGWHSPYIELQYEIDANWDKEVPLIFTVDSQDIKKDIEAGERLLDGFDKIRHTYIFRHFTQEILLIKKGGKYFYRLTEEQQRKIDHLPAEAQKKRIDKLIDRITKPHKLPFTHNELRDKKGKKRKIQGAAVFQFHPAVLDRENKRAYYPISVGLELTRGYWPKYWNKKTERSFWDVFLTAIEELTKDESFDFLSSLPFPGSAMPAPKETLPVEYPIVKIDRTTERHIITKFGNKNIFSTDWETLPTAKEVLLSAAKKTGNGDLTQEKERAALALAGQYQDRGMIWRDYGTHAIGFSARLYAGQINEEETAILKFLEEPALFPEDNKRLKERLDQVHLWRAAQRLAIFTLSEVYEQKRVKNLEIPKKKIIDRLGYTPEDKQAYQEIKKCFNNLHLCHYFIRDFSGKADKITQYGNFIYNIIDTPKTYILDINEKFVGCIIHMISGLPAPKSRKERQALFQRGYFDFPTRAQILTKNYSRPAERLTGLLISERGNVKLNQPDKGIKVVAQKIKKYIDEMAIRYSRADQKYKAFIKAIEEVEIIERTDPSISTLKQTKPSQALTTVLYIYVKDSSHELDRQMEKIISDKK